MKIKNEEGLSEWFYSMFDDGFWYTLTWGCPPKDKKDLFLEDDSDAEKVMEAIKILTEYENVCREKANEYSEL